jgi:two-component system, OmpR family, response regulator
MMGTNADGNVKVFLVDDDPMFLRLLEMEFTAQGKYTVETFTTGELCIASLNRAPDVIILDYHLDGIDEQAMNGIQTLDKIKSFKKEIPVVMLSSQDKIDTAISCMHHGATDYFVKSETTFLRLHNNIEAIFRIKAMEQKLQWFEERM